MLRFRKYHIFVNLGADALEAAQNYVKESRKQAAKKAQETAEEASELAQKKKRQATEL